MEQVLVDKEKRQKIIGKFGCLREASSDTLLFGSRSAGGSREWRGGRNIVGLWFVGVAGIKDNNIHSPSLSPWQISLLKEGVFYTDGTDLQLAELGCEEVTKCIVPPDEAFLVGACDGMMSKLVKERSSFNAEREETVRATVLPSKDCVA